MQLKDRGGLTYPVHGVLLLLNDVERIYKGGLGGRVTDDTYQIVCHPVLHDSSLQARFGEVLGELALPQLDSRIEQHRILLEEFDAAASIHVAGAAETSPTGSLQRIMESEAVIEVARAYQKVSIVEKVCIKILTKYKNMRQKEFKKNWEDANFGGALQLEDTLRGQAKARLSDSKRKKSDV